MITKFSQFKEVKSRPPLKFKSIEYEKINNLKLKEKIKKFFTGKYPVEKIMDIDFSHNEKITNIEFNKIKKFIPEIHFEKLSTGNINYHDVYAIVYNDFDGEVNPLMRLPKSQGYFGSPRVQISITKYEDEWFYLLIESFYPRKINIIYKCDQIEGLEECLSYLRDKRFFLGDKK